MHCQAKKYTLLRNLSETDDVLRHAKLANSKLANRFGTKHKTTKKNHKANQDDRNNLILNNILFKSI